MFGIGMTEMLFLGALGLILIGPDQIPEVARTIGRFINDIKRSADEVKKTMSDAAAEIPKTMREDLPRLAEPSTEHQPEEKKPTTSNEGDF
jgi:sec-independent protein translocase protein TatB